ncbi:hypothetical protein OS493_025704 [Desmophyllum pertusum]|uniref:Uncharacterized protein n=1 Tax=Desmophyllum pertusum TaxID=174260 RepID=A0A9X0D1M3_9CNID|nr:hypothetical protein OS493_025704 [Desmophyllum pertusum]
MKQIVRVGNLKMTTTKVIILRMMKPLLVVHLSLKLDGKEDGESEDGEENCTTKDGGLKKEPSEGEDASIEVTPEMGTQFDENLEMTKGDESYKEPSIFVLLTCWG